MTGAIHVCVADALPFNRNVMADKLAKMHPNWTVHLCRTAEAVLESWEQMDLLIIDNNFGADRLTGSQAIQLIRHQEHGEHIFIALWSAEHVDDDPGANCIWEKTVGPDTMASELCQLLGGGGDQPMCADGVATNR